MDFNVGFIGGGNMSTAIVKGILKHEAHPAAKIWVSGPHINNLKHWEEMGTNVTTQNVEVFKKCDVVFLGVKPAVLPKAIDECENALNKKPIKYNDKVTLVVSMLAGVTISRLQEELQRIFDRKSFNVLRIMPNTPMMVGAGTCLYTPEQNLSALECRKLVDLLSTSSLCEEVTEPMMDRLGIVTACGPAFMYMVIEAIADGAVKQGVPRAMALRSAAQTMIGSGQMVLQSGKHPGLLKDEVCSPGGTTICGVAALENGKLRATFINAIEAATTKTLGSHQK